MVGLEVGVPVGRTVRPFGVGLDVVGNLEGPPVGYDVGLLVVGRAVGSVEGCDEGFEDGCLDG